MIVVKLIGGLGNQLFQYAMGRNLAYKKNTKLKLDISAFQTYKLHNYSLQHFNIFEDFVRNNELYSLKKKSILSSDIFKPYYKKKHIKEKKLGFDTNYFKVPKNCYLEGYWQSEKYFRDIQDIIKKEFRVKHKILGENAVIADNIIKTNSVSIHIRRADYVSNKKTNNVHGTCSFKYYLKAINIIKNNVGNPFFFIFSDDIFWARKNFKKFDNITFVDYNNASKNYEDLRLMSLCKYNIIANSSFSWWGAWLNKNNKKIVIAPKKWFRNDKYKNDDLVPTFWIRL